MCANLKDLHFPTTQAEPWEPDYAPWRHGGWYTDARYPSGACGCVSNNYPDKKWRIACGPYFGLTFSTRKDAANAERAMTLAMCEAESVKAELLEACRSVLESLVGCDLIAHRGSRDSSGDAGQSVRAASAEIETLRAAIAKATGD